MNFEIHDKVIVITGAGRGLGRELALGLAGDGARVAVVARDLVKAERTTREIVSAFPDAPQPLAVVADVSDEEQVRRAAATVDEHWGRVDALINNAGWMPTGDRKRILDLDMDLVRRVLDDNLLGAMVATKHFAPLMIRGGGGRIIYLGSMLGVSPGPGAAAYGAAKAGVHLLSNVVHQELADDGIRTVALAPGLTDTQGMREAASAEHIARVAATYPGGRLGEPEDLVAFAAFLCSDAAQHLSGTFVAVRPVTG